MNERDVIEEGRRVLRMEGEAVLRLVDRLEDEFARAVRLVSEMKGRALVSGVGKSGIVARKIAGTLTSTGTPAFFLHPVEGVHGDVGMVLRDDLAILVSKSGESDELTELLRVVKRMGVPIISLTGDRRSTLALNSDVVLDVSVAEEACPHDLAPTASTTAALAMGDALAVAVLGTKSFGPDDFAKLHPGGMLGRKLLLKVADVMVTEPDQVPTLPPTASLREAMLEIAHKRGTVPVVDEDRRVVGVITAGDLTRYVDDREEFFNHPVSEAMNPDPKTIGPEALAAVAVYELEQHGIMALPVIDGERKLQGIVHLHDLMRAGVV